MQSLQGQRVGDSGLFHTADNHNGVNAVGAGSGVGSLQRSLTQKHLSEGPTGPLRAGAQGY